MSCVFYEQTVNSLMYLMMCIRHDNNLAMGMVSKYMLNPRKIHYEAVKWILRYLKSIVDYNLLFDELLENAKFLFDYIDVVYGQDLHKSLYTTGFVFTLDDEIISWRSTL